MFEFLEDLFNEFQKNSQKIQIRTKGFVNIEKGMKDEKKVKKDGEEEIKTVKATLSKTTDSLRDKVKGQFGNKVMEKLAKQEKLLDDFS